MRRLLIGGIGLLSALVVIETSAPAIADEDIARPRRERVQPRRAAAPRQVQPRQVAQPSNWSGGQLGGSNGASSVNNTFVEPGAYICPEFIAPGFSCFENFLSFSGHPVSYTIGAFAGYRWQFGMTVVGVEADIAWKKAETTGSLTAKDCFDESCFVFRTETKTGSITQSWDASFRGRFGILVTPWTLLYITGGVAFSEIKGSFSYTGLLWDCCVVDGTATAQGSWSDVRAGGTVGAGAETEIWTGVKARFEYRYADFGTYTKTLPVHTVCGPELGCTNPSSSVSIDLHPSFHTFRVGLGIDLPPL